MPSGDLDDSRRALKDPEQAGAQRQYDAQKELPASQREITLTAKENEVLAGQPPNFQGGLRARYNDDVMAAVIADAKATRNNDLLKALTTPGQSPTPDQVRRLEEIIDRKGPNGKPSLREEWIERINKRLETEGSNLRVGAGIGSDLTMERIPVNPDTGKVDGKPRTMSADERKFLQDQTKEYSQDFKKYCEERLEMRKEVVREYNKSVGLPADAGLDPKVRVPPLTRDQLIEYNKGLEKSFKEAGMDLAGEKKAMQEFKREEAAKLNKKIEDYNAQHPGAELTVRLGAGWENSSSLWIIPSGTQTRELRTDPTPLRGLTTQEKTETPPVTKRELTQPVTLATPDKPTPAPEPPKPETPPDRVAVVSSPEPVDAAPVEETQPVHAPVAPPAVTEETPKPAEPQPEAVSPGLVMAEADQKLHQRMDQSHDKSPERVKTEMAVIVYEANMQMREAGSNVRLTVEPGQNGNPPTFGFTTSNGPDERFEARTGMSEADRLRMEWHNAALQEALEVLEGSESITHNGRQHRGVDLVRGAAGRLVTEDLDEWKVHYPPGEAEPKVKPKEDGRPL